MNALERGERRASPLPPSMTLSQFCFDDFTAVRKLTAVLVFPIKEADGALKIARTDL